jgi:hypothetical protein
VVLSANGAGDLGGLHPGVTVLAGLALNAGAGLWWLIL